MTRRETLLLMAAGAALALAGCSSDDRFPDYRYKMTVYVDTPAGEKAYSSVRAVTQTEESSIQTSGTIVKSSVQGEAVIIDLPDGRTVYALLSNLGREGYAANIASVALLPPVRLHERDLLSSGSNKSQDDNAKDAQAMVKVVGPRDLPRDLRVNSLGSPINPPLPTWPMFVTFDDPTDPKTVREVMPEDIGVKRITIELTDEPVTMRIERRLPSYGPNSGFDQWYRSLPYNDPRQISKDAFISGMAK
jgi:hypothetical protein